MYAVNRKKLYYSKTFSFDKSTDALLKTSSGKVQINNF